MTPLAVDGLRRSMERVFASMLATCDAEGTPNVSMISQVHYVDSQHVALSYQFFNKTRANVMQTRMASVQITDPSTFLHHRLDLDYVDTRTSGPIFETMKAKLAGIASHHGLEGVFRLLGADIFRVRGIEAVGPPILQPERRGTPMLAAARACCDALSGAQDFEELTDAVLDGIVRHFDIRHTMMFFAENDGRLVAFGSRGYATSGIGAEVFAGEGVIGVAAREGVPIRIGHVSSDYRYGAALGLSALDAGLLAAPPRTIPMPGLGSPHSQIAVPVIVDGRVLGVLFAESEQIMRFWHEDEDALALVAAQLGLRIALLRQEEAAALAAAPPAAPSPQGVVTVRHYARDDSVFLDHDYLIKGVAGAILWRLLREHVETGRTEFCNRELRLDPALKLPDHAENLDARLVLLRRRLDEREVCIRIEKTGRGLFRLVTSRRIVLEEAGEGEADAVA